MLGFSKTQSAPLSCHIQHTTRLQVKAAACRAGSRSSTACASGMRTARLARTPSRGAHLGGSMRRAHRGLP